nr:MAG TPA: Penicillinase repressor [Caudoviricetes sp.]
MKDNALNEKDLNLLCNMTAVKALIDTQVILQLLVKKNIVTREEVIDMRNIVSSQPENKKIMDDIEETITEKALRSRFDELFKKVASGYEITKEEREFLLSFF